MASGRRPRAIPELCRRRAVAGPVPRPTLALPLLLALAACAPSPRPRAAAARPAAPVFDVQLPPAPAEAPLEVDDEPEPARRRHCVITGTGEHPLEDIDSRRPFEIFTSRASDSPAAIVRRTAGINVTWSELPGVRGGRRAKVALGGQKLLRMSGWASLEGRGFQMRRRADVHGEQVWVRGGSDVEIIGMERGQLRVRAATTLAAPAEVDALTACENVVYEPRALPRIQEEEPPKGVYAVTTGPRLELHAAPGGPLLLALTRADDQDRLKLQWLEARGDFVRVAGVNGNLGFHAWVPAPQVEQPHGGFGIGFGRSHCGGVRGILISARAVHDAEVTVGTAPGGPVIGVLEAEAEVSTEEERGDYISFSFSEREIIAPEGKAFWVLKSALGMK